MLHEGLKIVQGIRRLAQYRENTTGMYNTDLEGDGGIRYTEGTPSADEESRRDEGRKWGGMRHIRSVDK